MKIFEKNQFLHPQNSNKKNIHDQKLKLKKSYKMLLQKKAIYRVSHRYVDNFWSDFLFKLQVHIFNEISKKCQIQIQKEKKKNRHARSLSFHYEWMIYVLSFWHWNLNHPIFVTYFLVNKKKSLRPRDWCSRSKIRNLQGTTDVGRGDLLDPIVVANLPSFPLSKSYTHAFHPCNINLVVRNAWHK